MDAGAGRAATGRAELRSAEAALAGDVAVLREAREELDAEPGGDGRVVCPYKGLASFQGDDARYFFGRERLVAELVARLVGAPLLGVVGPSGSGKSSVVRAGLLPALAGGALPGSEAWAQVLIRPGAHPLRELGRATAGIADAARVLLAVDQFEETFTACTDEAERAAFISELAGARRPDGRIVVLAIRADHYGRCAAYPDLSALLAVNHVLVGPMRRDELRRAIEHPARRAGLEVERDLSDALVADVAPEPGALPMLSTALLELWQHRDGRRLRLSGYAATGGVRGAVARLAEDAYGGLDACAAARRPHHAAAPRRRREARRCRAPPGPARRTRDRRGRRRGRRGARGPPPAHRDRGRGRGGTRGAAPRMAALAVVAGAGRRGPARAPPARPGRR